MKRGLSQAISVAWAQTYRVMPAFLNAFLSLSGEFSMLHMGLVQNFDQHSTHREKFSSYSTGSYKTWKNANYLVEHHRKKIWSKILAKNPGAILDSRDPRAIFA